MSDGPAIPRESGLRYGRILLKLSGEALLGDRTYGVDPAFCAFIARQVAEVHGLGVQVGIVVGGGGSPLTPEARTRSGPSCTRRIESKRAGRDYLVGGRFTVADVASAITDKYAQSEVCLASASSAVLFILSATPRLAHARTGITAAERTRMVTPNQLRSGASAK